MTRLLLVEDHVLVRQSIRAFLESASLEVVGEANSGTQAVQMAQTLQPDLVIMDIHLPEMSGIEATRRIRSQQRDVRVIALTAYNEKAYQRALRDAGADGFVLKTAEFSELLNVIRSVIGRSGSTGGLDSAGDAPETESDNPLHLTEREREVLTCAAHGWTNKQIGGCLYISDRTVQVHLQTIYQKLGAASRTEAVSKALALGLISLVDGGDTHTPAHQADGETP